VLEVSNMREYPKAKIKVINIDMLKFTKPNEDIVVKSCTGHKRRIGW
jgi:hypothetical protein